MLHIFISFIFHDNLVKDSLWQKLNKLREDIFSGVHRMNDLLLNIKCILFKSSPSKKHYNTLNICMLQTDFLIFSGH